MDCSWIEPGVLAAGGIPLDDKDIEALHGQGVRAMLSLTERPITALRGISDGLFTRLDVVYHHVPIPDQFPPDMDQAREILNILAEMREQKRPVFLHCHAGIGRTGTVLHLYFLGQGLTLDGARARVRAKRPQCILLSDAQHAFLKHYEESNRRVV